MLTYNFENVDGPLYVYIYKCLKEDIISGKLKSGEKLPSKRTFAKNNGISTITIQNAYDQLVSEGYVYTLPKKGYYVANIKGINNHVAKTDVSYDIQVPTDDNTILYDLTNNGINPNNFPFSIWTRISRDIMANRKEELMQVSPAAGVKQLREAIANHLRSFRGLLVDPNQIIVGAGTEYLYSVITHLLGKEKIYTIENPGYKKLLRIYGQWDIECKFADMDEQGMSVLELRKLDGEIAHICPNHHFPTGITMTASRRYEVLAWANEKDGRYIIEDDYDSEFRLEGKPIPTLFSIDGCEKVIYINTFSKSLTPTIRISYMVLPVHLANRFYQTRYFYSCTVSNFEQYTLTQFIEQGYFEKHINRMRLYYARKRKKVIDIIKKSSIESRCDIMESDSGLHFLLKINSEISDKILRTRLREEGIRIKSLSDYYMYETEKGGNYLIINYSNLEEEALISVINTIAKIIN